MKFCAVAQKVAFGNTEQRNSLEVDTMHIVPC